MEASLAQFNEGGEIERIANSPLLSQINIRNILPGNLIEGEVPLSIVCTEDVPVEAENVAEIGESLKQEARQRGTKTGQLLPVLLAEVIDEPIDLLLITDGFHRTTSLKEQGAETVDSRVRLGSTMDDVIALRIQNAAKHRALRFARAVEWINIAWERTDWKDRLTPLQAFSLAQAAKTQDSRSSGKRIGLSPAESAELIAWANEKCEQWDLSASAVSSTLTIAANADPELVKSVRERRGRHNTLDALTAQHLAVIAGAFPGNFVMQQYCADIILANNLPVPKARGLVDAFDIADCPEETFELMEDPKFIKGLRAIHDKTNAQSPSKSKSTQKRSSRPANPTKKQLDLVNVRNKPEYTEMASLFVEGEVALAKMAIENVILRGRYTPEPLLPSSVKPSYKINVLDDITIAEPWDTTRTDLAAQHIEDDLADNLITALTKSYGLNPGDAERIVTRAGQRVVQDTQTGAIRHAELDDLRAIDLAMRPTLRDELAKYKHGEQSVKIAEDDGPDGPTVRSVKLLEALPKLNKEERRLTVLHGLLRLSPHVIGQVMNVREDRVINQINFLGIDLRDSVPAKN